MRIWNRFRRNRAATTVIETSGAAPQTSDRRLVFQPPCAIRSPVTGNHWEVVSLLGVGGMGSVYLVRDEQGRLYALKTFNAALFHEPSRWRLLELEAATWILLDHHPNIVAAQWCERIEDKLCILAEYVPGGTVEQQLGKGPLAPKAALTYGLAICDAMVYADRKIRLVHRDIKPANCLLDIQGRLKLTDFGIAWRPDSSRPGEEAEHGGTPGYKAPEQYDRGRVDARADIYAFGATLFEMLSGVNVGRLAMVSTGLLFQHAASNRRLRRISTELRDLIVRSLQPLPDDRPSSFAAVRDELALIYGNLVKQPAPPPPAVTPLRIDELQNKAIALQILELYEQALACFESALVLAPQDYELWLGKSAVLHLSGRNREAIEAADRGLAIEVRCGDLWNNRGMALLDTGQIETALASFARALDYDPNDPVVWRNRGLALYRLGRLADAIEAYDHGLARDRRDARLYQLKGQALLDEGQLEEAANCLKQGIEISPMHAGILHGLGVTYHRLHLLDQAMVWLNRALSVLPGDRGILLSKAVLLLDLKEYAEAMRVAADRSARVPGDVRLEIVRFAALWHSGQTVEAELALADLWRKLEDDPARRTELQMFAVGLGVPQDLVNPG